MTEEPRYEPDMIRAEFSRGENYAVSYLPWQTHLYISNEIAPLIKREKLEELSRILFPNGQNKQNQIIGMEQYENSLKIKLPPLIDMTWNNNQERKWIDGEWKISQLIEKIEMELGELAA